MGARCLTEMRSNKPNLYEFRMSIFALLNDLELLK
jgi:hypothetical protein